MSYDIDLFLRETGMHYHTIDMNLEMDRFGKEMKKGLIGKPSSLMMLPSFITIKHDIPSGKEVTVVDAGGTNLRVATIYKDYDGKFIISNMYKSSMPGTKEALTVNQFFEAITDALQPVLHISDRVGFCFSFPCEILPNKDGRILEFNKEVQIHGAAGHKIGESINAVLRNRNQPTKQFVILNDTVATMLAGIAFDTTKHYESYIGYILGTGTNTCYLESTKNIIKLDNIDAMYGYMPINMESGGYNNYAQGFYDLELDRASNAIGEQKMEKMISGAYQGIAIYKTIQGAVEKGIFTSKFAQKFSTMDRLSLRQVDDFYANPVGTNDLAALVSHNINDRKHLMQIIEVSVERAARITTISLAAIMNHIGAGKDPERPMCIIAEGTSFRKSVLFKGKLDAYIKDFLNKQIGIYCDIISIDNTTLIGTGLATLMLN